MNGIENRTTSTKRQTAHYLFGFVLLSVYGGQVCPFLESLTVLQLILPILVTLLIQYSVLSLWLVPRLVNKPYQAQSRYIFQIELSVFVIGGLAVAIFNALFYGFPFGSGAKLILAMSLMGFFAAIDISLYQEWHLSKLFEYRGINLNPDDHFFSQPKKLALFTSICAIFLVGVIFLVINKDLDWLINVGNEISVMRAQQLILLELAFVVAVLLAHIFNLVISYSRNLDYFLTKETLVLQKATKGDFTAQVPVSTNDEFGVMAKHTNLMVEGLRNRTEELKVTRDVTIHSLASLAETRDNETGNHILRTQRYVQVLAENLKSTPEFSKHLDQETISLLFKSAPLHDIGKVGIPDNILLKPGKLSGDEFTIMKKHPQLGGEALRVAEERLGSNSFLKLAREIALTHHEKWDGTGYPNQLKGDDIPFSGRLMAVADVYDALISERVYKPAFTHEKAKEIILEGRGTQFDPKVIDAFITSENCFIEVAKEYTDKP